ncbi:hypothetical protein GW756_02440 [bacterium]|nr:hypothetical protein [bacterium]NCQ55652.1 hypothetical protein [Candidatus Parcubacteria bacterium]NCS67477.1 hypothetical protein [Candidatus Peregrinibacteria bacterium]NCS96203.1 hypothetical protein [bacterium]
MKKNHEEPATPINEVILNDTPETTQKTNLTIKVYLYGEDTPTDTYQFDA